MGFGDEPYKYKSMLLARNVTFIGKYRLTFAEQFLYLIKKMKVKAPMKIGGWQVYKFVKM